MLSAASVVHHLVASDTLLFKGKATAANPGKYIAGFESCNIKRAGLVVETESSACLQKG